MKTIELSIILPVYNEAQALDLFFQRLSSILEPLGIDYEIICVNDGSNDATLAQLLAWHERDARIKIIDFTRNFGKESALTAGLEYVSGQAVIPIDADLQDPPELIPAMLEQWRDGYEVVLAVRDDRSSDTFMKRASANLFYCLINQLSDIQIPHNAGDFRLIDRCVVQALEQLKERNRFMKGLFAWAGFRQCVLTYTRPQRVAGESKWCFWKLWNFALDGIVSFTSLPLRVWSYFGFIISFLAVFYALFVIAKVQLYGVDVPGYASLAVMVLFFSGINLISIGIIGEYLARIFTEAKQRPIYLIRNTYGLKRTTSKK